MSVEHEPDKHRFVIHRAEGEGVLLYEKVATRTLDFQHVRVDSALRGKGIAAERVRAALEYARDHELRIIPTCPYVQRWIEAHSNERDLVVTRSEAI